MDAGEPKPTRTSRWAALSLELKFPVVIGAFLLATTVSLAVAGYVAVRRNALAAGGGRAAGYSSQLRDYFATQVNQIVTATATAATRPEMVAYAASPSEANAERVRALFRQARNTTYIGVSIRSRDGSVALTTVPESLHATYAALENDIWLGEQGPTDSARVDRLRVVGDSLRFASIAPVSGRPDVLVFIWWRLNASEQSRSVLANLFGPSVRLLLGNVRDSAWTDLTQVVDRPNDLAEGLSAAMLHEHDGERFLMRAEPVPRTPWAIAIEIPEAEITGTAMTFARQVGAIALLVMAVGLLLAWRVSRDITRPLADLTDAASSIAHGDYGQLPRIDRADELGRLSGAFGRMAHEVEQSRTRLEAKVDERTRELNDAVTQLHEAQDTLVRREKMATLGQLASGVGHELRNPLGVMTNAVYYLRAVLASQPENVREYLDILHQQIALSEKIVADLLDFTRSRSPHRTPSDLRRIVRAQVAQLGASGHSGVSLIEEFPDDLPPVLVDGSQAGQVVLNLFTNAAQAMDGQGTITIRALRDIDRVHLEVMDTGPGVAPENLEKVFEPLFTTKARGIGLGLALSRTLARANGGELAARNNQGRGATFTLTLPVAEDGP